MKRAGYPSSSGGGERGLHKNSYVLFFLTIGALVLLQVWNSNNSSNHSNCIQPAAAEALYHPQSPIDVLTASRAASGAPSSTSNATAWDAPPYRCA